MPDRPLVLAFKNVSFQKDTPALNWDIIKGQQWLITGEFESAKDKLYAVLSGKKSISHGIIEQYLEPRKLYVPDVLLRNSYCVNFHHPLTLLPDAFYQQRYHASESDSGPSLREYIKSHAVQPIDSNVTCNITTNGFADGKFRNHDSIQELLKLFQLNDRMDEPIIHLSTGEFRKLAIILGFLKQPRILILKEPYAGLDAESIEILDSSLFKISDKGLNIIVFSALNHIPAFITNILSLNFDSIATKQATVNSEKNVSTNRTAAKPVSMPSLILSNNYNFNTAFSLKNLTIQNGAKKILDKINWQVKKGEKWALLGRNGAGKSMLLSVIYADHPQAYSNHIELFDGMRGSGESIWEIREKIGYFSSELFMYADKSETLRQIAYKQMRSNPYKFIPVSPTEADNFVKLFDFFSLGKFIDSPIESIPASAQRLAFLVAIFMKNAPLIILDEPFHGFDFKLIEKMKAFLNDYCSDRTFVFVTHRKHEIPTIVDKSFIIIDGKGETNIL